MQSSYIDLFICMQCMLLKDVITCYLHGQRTGVKSHFSLGIERYNGTKKMINDIARANQKLLSFEMYEMFDFDTSSVMAQGLNFL